MAAQLNYTYGTMLQMHTVALDANETVQACSKGSRGVAHEPLLDRQCPYTAYPTHLQNLTRLSQLPVTSRMYTFSPSRDPKLLKGAQLTELQPSLESWIKVVCHSSFGWCCRILTRPSLEAHASIRPSSWGAHATLYTGIAKEARRCYSIVLNSEAERSLPIPAVGRRPTCGRMPSERYVVYIKGPA